MIEFDDLIHGGQRFASEDIGDFVVSRADGSAAFFLGNAVDDAAMGVTLVLRGDYYLANTPRQILLSRHSACRCRATGTCRWCRFPWGTAFEAAGSAGLHDLRDTATCPARDQELPAAPRPHLWLRRLARGRRDAVAFRLSRVSRLAAHFDEHSPGIGSARR